MTEKEIKKLNRQDLLVLLAEQRERADRLEKELKKAEETLVERHLVQKECGTMAEAALKLNAVFQAADEAAAQYLENIRLFKEKQETACQENESASRKRSEEILHSAQLLADEKRKEAEQILRDAQEQAKVILSQAETEMEQKKQQAEELINQSKETAHQEKLRAEEMIRQAQEQATQEMKKIDMRWDEIHERIRGMEKEYTWLRGIINQNAGD